MIKLLPKRSAFGLLKLTGALFVAYLIFFLASEIQHDREAWRQEYKAKLERHKAEFDDRRFEPPAEEKYGVQEGPGLKIDWHDWEFILQEANREGVGEQGAAVMVTEEDRRSDTYKKFYDLNGFNGFVSDLISYERSVADIRHPL